MTTFPDELVEACCRAGFKAGRSLGTYENRTADVDHFVQAVLQEYVRQLSDAMEGVIGFTEIRDRAMEQMLEQHKRASEAEQRDRERQLVFAGIDPGRPDGDKSSMVLVTMTAEGPRVVTVTDDPAIIHEHVKKGVE